MAILTSCCCFSTVRKGSYASAIFTLIYNVIMITVLSIFVHEEQSYYSGNSSVPQTSSFLEPDTISPVTMAFTIALLCGAITGFLASLLLLHGLQKDERLFLIPWILYLPCHMLIEISHNIYLLLTNIWKQFHAIPFILYTVDFFLFIIDVFALLCVISQYQEYKAGRGRDTYDRWKNQVNYIADTNATSYLSSRRAVTYNESSPTATGHSMLHPSTVITADDLALSPNEKPLRRGSSKHVQFGLFDDSRRSSKSNGKTDSEDSADRRSPALLSVLTEEPSWALSERNSEQSN